MSASSPTDPSERAKEAPPGGRSSSSSLPASLTGQTIEHYAVEALIGKGGMGEVYRAVDTRLRRKVALKIVRPEKDRPDAVARLFREARAAAALSHPNTVAIHDIGESAGLFYIVMELVNGVPLLAYVGDDRVPIGRKLRWLADIGRALDCAHKSGVIHRDVKPSNVMISDDGVAKVLDFGLAKPVKPMSTDFRTQAGRVVGTVRYMSPEQIAGAEADARSDQYALGVTAYELLSGVYPGGVPLGVPVPLDTLLPDFPSDGARLIARMIKPTREERFGAMSDVVTAFEDVANNRPVRVSLPVSAEVDTVRQPPPVDLEATLGSAGAKAPPKMTPAALAATLPANDALGARQAAHVGAKTLLSRAAPRELTDLIRANPVPPSPNEEKTAPLRRPVIGGDGAGRSAPPRTLASSPVRAPSPPAPPVAPIQPMPPPAAPRGGAMPVHSGYPPPSHRRSLVLVFVPVVIVVLAFAAFAGTYLGARARPAAPNGAVSMTVTPATTPTATVEEIPSMSAAPVEVTPKRAPTSKPTSSKKPLLDSR